MKSIGIDIGTTTISIVIADASDFTLVHKITLPNDASLSSPNPWERLQDVSRILASVQSALDEILSDYKDVSSIGLTGQMHGIVCLDESGNAVSPLYTWQDGRGNLPAFQDGKSLCAILSQEYGIKASSGYGLVTHLYHVKKHLVPPGTVTCCTIADYLGMRLTGRTSPLLHVSQAAGLGLYDVKASCFRQDILAQNGVEPAFLPHATDEFALLGTFRGIPVSVSIGDNQASFLGSVRHACRDLLVNIGTGSQISVLSNAYAAGSGIEARPFTKDSCLLVGAALCGGSAYALLERFFREYAVAAGGADVIVVSGNGARKNTALQAILQNRFGMPLEIVPYEEEAAFGAAISSLAAIGRISVRQWLEGSR